MRAARELLKELEYEVLSGSVDINVNDLVYNTAKVTKECLFVCIKGMAFDSHEAAAKAAGAGAVVIVAERPVEVPEGITVVLVKDTRYALALISAAYFHYPARRLKVIGITGTKGKTTTAFMIRSILEHAGISTGLIGTIETIIGDRHIPADNTTPESYAIQEDFAQMAAAGCKVVVMEVSSQGLKLHRTAGILFDIGIFTNLAPDHIGPGEHESFEEYLACKSRLFRQSRIGIANIDDTYCMEVLKDHTCELETYGFSGKADLRASEMKLISRPGYLGASYQVSGLADFAVCRHFGISGEDMLEALKEAKTKGRIEKIRVSDDFTLMIDYAHNAMSLESLLTTLKEYGPKRLVCLFGCGGNRSRRRRFEMGEVSGRLADLTVITSDNPRFEEPQAIIDDIKTGIEKTDGDYVEIIDRKEAIRYVIEHGRPGDVIVLAGKGHEDYQEIRGVKYPMDERVLIQEVMEELNQPEIP